MNKSTWEYYYSNERDYRKELKELKGLMKERSYRCHKKYCVTAVSKKLIEQRESLQWI